MGCPFWVELMRMFGLGLRYCCDYFITIAFACVWCVGWSSICLSYLVGLIVCDIELSSYWLIVDDLLCLDMCDIIMMISC